MSEKSLYKDTFDKINEKFLKYYNFESKSIFDLLAMASFIKALEINILINQNVNSENSFLYLSNLRGTCEELISLKYLKEKINEADRNDLIIKLSQVQLSNDIAKQFSFLQKYRPFQPTLNAEKLETQNEKLTAINEILHRNGIKTKNKLPPTEQLALATGLSEFYEFMYRASSTFVHFNPRTMMRTVWYDNNKTFNFSISNFNSYYWDFSSFYGAYQFLILYKELKEIVDPADVINVEIMELKKTFKYRSHYPEIVTYEELNIDRPTTKWTVLNSLLDDQLFE
ncbi:hypothetical protein ABID42_001828 [Arcicella rosea]|uniref:DUF5677 domain-containing protein n=1 Tax=Arcicella rosea TaxID=502909 RepID=UPI00345DD613